MTKKICPKSPVLTLHYKENMRKDVTVNQQMQTCFCPVCLERGEGVPMIKGMATGYYWQYRCPRCGNLALVERGEKNE